MVSKSNVNVSSLFDVGVGAGGGGEGESAGGGGEGEGLLALDAPQLTMTSSTAV